MVNLGQEDLADGKTSSPLFAGEDAFTERSMDTAVTSYNREGSPVQVPSSASFKLDS